MRVAYCGGYWATNIGNSFYDLGSLYVLKKIFGDENVFFINDLPQWFWTQKNRQKNIWDFHSHLDNFDLFFLSGPVFCEQFPEVYKDILNNLKKKGTEICFISSGFSKYDQNELNLTKEFLKKLKPKMILTRDSETYNELKNYTDISLSGICTAFYLNDIYKSNPIASNHIVYNFDTKWEPAFDFQFEKADDKNKNLLPTYKGRRYFNFPKQALEIPIVRTVHNCFSSKTRDIFNRNNTYFSDLPYNYIHIYANSLLTLSERVHACVATLAFGNPAMYFKLNKRSHTNRINLFKSVGATSILEKPTKANFNIISEKKNQIEESLRKLL